jgi:H+/Cl- antiporter ClcA
MASLAGTVTLLFAPSVALGAWAGLAVAALIPEPGAPDEPVGEDGMDASAVEASSREVTG